MTLLATIVGLALVDSLNPTSVSVAGYLAIASRRSALHVFIATVYATYLAVALVLTLGVGPAVQSVIKGAPNSVIPVLQLGVGVLLVLKGVHTWRAWSARQVDGGLNPRAACVLGVAATAMDLPTATPLIIAAGLIVVANLDVVTQVGLVLIYVLVYVAPLVGMAAVRRGLVSVRVPITARARESVARMKPILFAGMPIAVGCVLGGRGILALA
jgi:hypothetical protein